MKIFRYTDVATLYISFVIMLASCQPETNSREDTETGFARTYYISNSGNDSNDGSSKHPWKNIIKVKDLNLADGDSVLLQGGQTFTGTLIINYHTASSSKKRVVVTSFGNGTAVINSGNEIGVLINNGNYIQLKNIKVNGAGRKDGNITSGVSIANSNNIEVDSVEVSGYQKSGLSLLNCSNIIVQNVYAHDNGFAGISVGGSNLLKTDCRNIEIKYCRAENNPGDPTDKNNHSGNGIIVSQCTNVKIAYCTATNNGWDMPRTGNGPVGIWAWEADSVTIEHCLAYRNKTSKGGGDGGGFDLDGGVTNSIIQYCLSYENEGSGIGLFEFDYSGPWYNNTIRYNISINDGNVSGAKAGIFIWNASTTQNLKNCFIYNNTIYNNKNAAINYSIESNNEGFVFYNNILVGNKEIISGNNITGRYLGNCWWSVEDGFNVNGITSFTRWANQKQQEILNGNIAGKSMNPGFVNMDNINMVNANTVSSFQSARITNPVLLNGGIDIEQLFGIIKGGKDFNGNVSPLKGIGASF